MLYGRYEHTIDAKGRLSVPSKLRDKLGSQFMAAAVLDFVDGNIVPVPDETN